MEGGIERMRIRIVRSEVVHKITTLEINIPDSTETQGDLDAYVRDHFDEFLLTRPHGVDVEQTAIEVHGIATGIKAEIIEVDGVTMNPRGVE